MIQEITSNIVMFFLGSALTFIVTLWTKAFKKLGFVEFGVRALLRNRMIQTVASFDQMYDAGKALGEDGYLDELKKVMHEDLQHETH